MPNEPIFRSPLLLDRHHSSLLVVDVQAKLLPSIRNQQRLVWNIGRLLQAAQILDVPRQATEQYPRGLGATIEELRAWLPAQLPEKSMFSCRECSSLIEQAQQEQRTQFVLAGIEAHVCVQQTALDMISAGFDVFVVADAVGSRFSHDYRIALQRMANAGVTITSTEAALFEWCEVSGTAEFKQISQLVKDAGPAATDQADNH